MPYTLFCLSLFTALRRSELRGLRWDDFDLDLGHMSVNRSLHRIGGKTLFRTPKSAKGRRQVALPRPFSYCLRHIAKDSVSNG